jgi:hypothetical protein
MSGACASAGWHRRRLVSKRVANVNVECSIPSLAFSASTLRLIYDCRGWGDLSSFVVHFPRLEEANFQAATVRERFIPQTNRAVAIEWIPAAHCSSER